MSDNDDINVEEFFNDPKNAKQANFLRGSFNHLLAEAATKEQEQREKEKAEKKPTGILDFLFPATEKKDGE